MKPGTEMFIWLCMLAATIGIDLVGMQDALAGDQHGWVAVFLTIAMVKTVIYAHVALWWSRWVS